MDRRFRFPPATGSELGDVVEWARHLGSLFGLYYGAGFEAEEERLAVAREACVLVCKVLLEAAELPETEPADLLDDDRFLAVCLTAAPKLRKARGKLFTRGGFRGLIPVADDASPREKTVRVVANLLLETIRAHGRQDRGRAAPSQ